MKKRLLGFFLCIVLLMTLLSFSSMAAGPDANGITNPDPTQDDSGNLNLTKELSPGSDGTYDITMKSWATGEVKAVTEKIPTDFVVVVDQSGSMDTRDMPTGTPTVRNNVNLETVANGAYYYKDGDNYYRVYGARDYLFRYYPANYFYVGDIVERLGQRLGWFMGNTESTANFANQLYFREVVDGKTYYQPVTMTVAGRVGTYDVRFKYTSKRTNSEVWFNRDDETYMNGHHAPWYKNLAGGGLIDDNWGFSIVGQQVGYPQVDSIVQDLYREDEMYAHSTFQIIAPIPIILPNGWKLETGMYVNYPVYDRHVGYTKLCYRDENGVEHDLPSNQNSGQTKWEYCDDNGIARSQQAADSARPTYSGLYTFPSNTDRITALKAALNEFAQAVANEEDAFGKVDNRVSIVGFSSSGYNNTELLTHTERDIANNSTNGWQKNTCDGNVSEYYGKGLVEAATGDTAGTVNSKITRAITAITANGGTQPEDGLNMAYKVLTNRGDTTYTIRSGAQAGQTVDRNTVVIFFTDGQPGDYHYSNQYSEANEVVQEAKNIKGYKNTTVFSIGVFGESDANPLTYDGRNDYTQDNQGNTVRISSLDRGYWEYLGGWVETYQSGSTYYCLRRQWRPNGDGYPANANDTIFDYMSVVSSNYPDAQNYIAPAWLNGNFSGTYTDATDGAAVRKKSSAEATNKYYRSASSQDTLIKAFLQTITMNNEETETQATLNETAVFHDAVNLNDFSVSGATYKVEWQPMKWENGAVVTDGDPVQQGSTQAVPNTGVIDYSGFNYSEEYTAENHPGKQLIITVRGLKPTTVSRILESNDGKVTIKAPGDPKAAIEIETPTLDLRDKYFAVHHILVNKTNRNLTEEDITLYPISGNTPFNITNKLLDNDNYLYGGVYEGFEDGALGDPMTFGNDTGLSFTPVAGTDYYLKEVPTDYLRTKILWRSSGPNMAKSYLISTLDSEVDYCRTGFIVDGKNQTVDNNDIYRYIMLANGAIAGSGASGTNVSVYVSDISNDADAVRAAINEALKTVPVNADGSETEDFSNRENVTIKEAFRGTNGFLSMYEIPIQSESITGKAFWVTHDGLMVTGNNIRTVVNGRATADNSADVSITPYSENAVNYEDQLNLKALFVGADDTDEEEPTEDDGVKLAGYTTSLNGNIAMNFYLDLSDEVAADKDAYMQFTLPGGNHTEEVVSLADAKKQVRGGKTYYVFSAGVAAKDMTSDIKAQFVKGDGTKSDVWTYTIKQYCDYIRNHPDAYDEESVALVENMLNYGGYAQTYFKHNTDKMANADLDLALPEVDLDASFDPVITGEAEGLTYKGSSAMLTTTTGLRHYFELAGSAEDYTFKANGKELEIQSDKNGSYVLIDNIKAKDLKKPIALTVTDKNGNTFKLSYSVYTNIKQVTGDEQFSADSHNLMKALYGYGEAAIAYFAAHA